MRRLRPLPWARRLTNETWEEDFAGIVTVWEPGMVLAVFCDNTACGLSTQIAERLRRESGLERIVVIPGGEAQASRLRAAVTKTAR